MCRIFSRRSGSCCGPTGTLAALAERRRLDTAARIVLTYGLLYTVTASILSLRRCRPVVKPMLPIPEDRYYAWQTGFTLPVVFSSWGVAASTGFQMVPIR